MLSKQIAEEVLGRCLITGGDFAEIFEEDTLDNSISILNGKVENSVGGRAYGIGIRIFKGFKSVYAYTNNNSLHGLLETAEKAALALGELKEDKSIILTKKEIINAHPTIYLPSSIELNKKIGVMKIAYNAAKDYHNEISQVSVGYADKEQNVLIANTEGLYVEDKRIRTRLYINAVASANGENQTGTEGPGRRTGFEMFKYIDIFRKTLSGSIGRTMINMEFPSHQETEEEGTQRFLMKLVESKLQDDELLNQFYDKIIENYGLSLIHI